MGDKFVSPEDIVTQSEYDAHKIVCGSSFEHVFKKLDKMERAMFGEPDLKRKGVFDMTTEMYNSVKMAQGSERLFWGVTKVSGAILTIIGAFWAVIELVKRLK